jgi:hypothetical protein
MSARVNYKAFYNLMTSFLDDCVLAYPFESNLKTARNAWSVNGKDNIKQTVDEFMKLAGPNAAKIIDRDASIFSDKELFGSLPYVGRANWAVNFPRSPKATQDAIWDYLTGMLNMATTLTMPKESMQPVMEIAEKYVQQIIENNEGVELTPEMVSVMVASELAKDMEKIEAGERGEGLSELKTNFDKINHTLDKK